MKPNNITSQLTIALLLLLFGMLPLCLANEEIIAYIDDKPVTIPKCIAEKNSQSVVDIELLSAMFSEKGGKIPQNFLNDRIKNIVVEEFSGSESKFQDYLSKSGSTLEELMNYEKKKFSALAMRQILSGKEGSKQDKEKRFNEALNKLRSKAVIKLVDIQTQ